MDYMLVSKERVGCLLNIEVRRDTEGGMSDHFLVEGRLKLNMNQGRGRETSLKRALKVSELDQKEKVVEYQ